MDAKVLTDARSAALFTYSLQFMFENAIGGIKYAVEEGDESASELLETVEAYMEELASLLSRIAKHRSLEDFLDGWLHESAYEHLDVINHVMEALTPERLNRYV